MHATEQSAAPPPPRVRPCTLDTIGAAFTGDARPETVALVTAYFARFAAPIIPAKADAFRGAECVCGEALTGLLGGFRYGLAHGEGYCSDCGRAVRSHHYLRDADGAEVLSLTNFPLLYLTPAEMGHAAPELTGEDEA